MGVGLENLFQLVYEFFHFVIAWIFPQQGMIDRTEMGVLIRGKTVKVLKPGPYWHWRRWSDVYVDNVVRKVREMTDQVLTTADGCTVRAGGVIVFEITDIETWIVNNEDPEAGLLVAAQRVLRDFVKANTFEETQELEAEDIDDDADAEDPLTSAARKALNDDFGVMVRQLGLTVFAETEARDHNHTGSAFSLHIGGQQ